MNEIVKAYFRGRTECRTAPVFQYDSGMRLEFVNLELPTTFRVDFSNSVREKSKAVMGENNMVEIPPEYFIPGKMIYAWVVVPNTNGRNTVYQVTIPLALRSEPTDDVPTPSEQTIIDQAITALNTAVAEANIAVSHYPIIVGGYWMVWDVANEQYISTGVEAEGNGIASAIMNADYTLTLNFTNGTSYTTPSIRGESGKDGVSPAVTVEEITGGHRLTITDADHPSGQIVDVMDGTDGRGIVSVEKTGTSGQVDTYTITYTSGSPTTFTVTNGTNGTDGVSPAVTIAAITSGHSVTITDADHPSGQSFEVLDGQDGSPGADGVGVPAGGTAGQILRKTSATDYATEWADQNPAVSVSGSTPSITAMAGVRYVCGEVSTLAVTVPASGCVDIVFESGSTATVLTVTSAKSGVSAIKWANGWDGTCEADTVYEINILDGEWGVVAAWT